MPVLSIAPHSLLYCTLCSTALTHDTACAMAWQGDNIGMLVLSIARGSYDEAALTRYPYPEEVAARALLLYHSIIVSS